MTIVLGIDPGFANLGMVIIEWVPKARRVLWHKTVETNTKMSASERWHVIISELAVSIGLQFDAVACEEMSGVRHGHDDRGSSNANTDPLLGIQGAVRALCHVHGRKLFLVRSQTSYAACGASLSRCPGESSSKRKTRQKAATRHAATLLFSGAEMLTEHECDAAVHAAAVAMGKGERC